MAECSKPDAVIVCTRQLGLRSELSNGWTGKPRRSGASMARLAQRASVRGTTQSVLHLAPGPGACRGSTGLDGHHQGDWRAGRISWSGKLIAQHSGKLTASPPRLVSLYLVFISSPV